MRASAIERPVGLVVAISPHRVIGREGRIPWKRPADLRRFKRLTLGGTLLMGRLTFESIGRPLPGRENIVVTRQASLPGVKTVPSLKDGVRQGSGPIWVIGGARLFQEALQTCADFVDLTHVPDLVPVEGSVLFPLMNPEHWVAGPLSQNDEDPTLWHQRYVRRPF